jgi:hypothetical protein
MHNDEATVFSEDESETRLYTQQEVDELLANPNHGMNRSPAYEEGPHLADETNRAAKYDQMVEAGLTGDEEDLTDDMRTILKEQG